MKKKPTTQSGDGLSSGLRRYLYFTAAITGGSIMIVEILGAKMLSPFLGTSHFVWTAQIATALIALSFGYYVGGWLVDRSLRLGRMYAAIIVAGVYLTLTVVLHQPLANACLAFNLAAGSLLASLFLFFVPLSLLAMVGPFFVRVLSNSLHGVGGNVGRLTAISTLGSFLGTILIGYVLIPFFPNSIIMSATALVIIVVSVVYFLVWGRTGGNKSAAVISILIAAGFAFIGQGTRQWKADDSVELFQGNSNFGLLQVVQDKNSSHRYYLNDYLTQNTYDTNNQQSISMFTYMLHGLAKAYAPRIEDVLCIGLGIGIVPMDFVRDGARVDVAEINPAVVPVAAEFFDFEPEKVHLSLTDGRHFINACTNTYDAVILDAFLGDSCPSHLMTREAFSGMGRVLNPQGVLVMNTFADLDGKEDFLGASLYKTLTNVFPSVVVHRGRNGNTLFVASPRPELTILNEPSFDHVSSLCRSYVEDAFATRREPNPAHGRVLTDDYNPVEFYDAANRESLRRLLARAAMGD